MENPSLEVLQTEVEFYRQNQVEIEQEIRNLITDNQKLSKQVGKLLKEKLENARNYQDNDYKELEDVKRQVSVLTKEIDSLNVLWQTSQKTIEALENELKTYQGYDNTSNQEFNNESRRELELKLETSLADYIELELKQKELLAKLNTAEYEIISKDKEINTYKERGKDLENTLDNVKKDLEELRINLAVEKKSCEDVKAQLTLCQKESVNLIKKEAEAKSKVAEALQLFDVVAAQKNEAYKKISEITGELMETKRILENVERETETKYKTEFNEIKDRYNEKVDDMLQHIRNLDTELVEKGLLLNKAIRENKILQAANESYLKQHKENLESLDPKLALAEQRLETMFQELVASERRNMQLVCEKQCLAMDITRLQDVHTREIKRRDWEEKLLKNRCEELQIQVENLHKSLEETHGLVNKLQNMMTSRTELNQKMVTTKEDELIELNKHLENQMELSKKWKESYVEMSEKLKNRIEILQKENKEFRIKLNLPCIGSSNNSSVSS